MAQTTAGLTNGGKTAHYQVSYDDTFNAADGVNRANALLASCEQDFNLMAGWFQGVNFEFSFPIQVQIVNATGGASWQDPSNIQRFFGYTITVTINPGTGTPASFVRYLLVSEVTEMFMSSIGNGNWAEQASLFHGADEGSKGEGLSRFLGAQFLIANGFGAAPPSGFGVVAKWLNGGQPDFVDVNPDDHNPDPTTGCTTCFLYFLHTQLNFSINQIIAGGAATLAGVFQNLTNSSGAWNAFSTLVSSHYPPGPTYNPAGDNIFPVSTLTQFFLPPQITCGYSQTTVVVIDLPAMAEVNIALASDDPSALSVPAQVTIPVGATSASVTFTAPAIAGPFTPKTVNVHATYAGKTLTVAAVVAPPALASLTLNPSTVTCGSNSTATVSLNAASTSGAVTVNLVCAAPGFATVPATATIPQNQISANFTVTTPNIAIPFKPAKATIVASYSGTDVEATLNVNPSVIAGILNALTVFPATVTIGGSSRGTVTLIAAVPTPTLVGLAALELAGGPALPLPGNTSTIASVPASITIPAGQTSAIFTITTHGVLSQGTSRQITIMAGAVVEEYAGLTVKS